MVGCCHRSPEQEAWEPHLLLLPPEDTPLTSHQPCLVLLLSSLLSVKPHVSTPPSPKGRFYLTTVHPPSYFLGLQQTVHLTIPPRDSRAHPPCYLALGPRHLLLLVFFNPDFGPRFSGCPVLHNCSGPSEPPTPSSSEDTTLTSCHPCPSPTPIFSPFSDAKTSRLHVPEAGEYQFLPEHCPPSVLFSRAPKHHPFDHVTHCLQSPHHPHLASGPKRLLFLLVITPCLWASGVRLPCPPQPLRPLRASSLSPISAPDPPVNPALPPWEAFRDLQA